MRLLKGIGQFWYDFVIGDDWKIAAAVCIVLLIGAGCVLAGFGAHRFLAPLLALGVAAGFVIALLVGVRGQD